VLNADHTKSGGAVLDHKGTMPLSTEAPVDRGPHDYPVGARAVGAKHFLPVEDPGVAILARQGANGGDVGTGAGLGHGEGPPVRPRRIIEDAQEAALLLLVAHHVNRRAAEPRSG
jgi:hypothetical protein